MFIDSVKRNNIRFISSQFVANTSSNVRWYITFLWIFVMASRQWGFTSAPRSNTLNINNTQNDNLTSIREFGSRAELTNAKWWNYIRFCLLKWHKSSTLSNIYSRQKVNQNFNVFSWISCLAMSHSRFTRYKFLKAFLWDEERSNRQNTMSGCWWLYVWVFDWRSRRWQNKARPWATWWFALVGSGA